MSKIIRNAKEPFLVSVSEKFRVLSHHIRLKILAVLEDEDMTVSELQKALGIEQAIASQHLIAMKNHGILGYNKDGARHVYYIEDRNVCGILRCIEKAHERVRQENGE